MNPIGRLYFYETRGDWAKKHYAVITHLTDNRCRDLSMPLGDNLTKEAMAVIRCYGFWHVNKEQAQTAYNEYVALRLDGYGAMSNTRDFYAGSSIIYFGFMFLSGILPCFCPKARV